MTDSDMSNHSKDDELLDIMEPGHIPTDKELDDLNNDASLDENAKLLSQIATALRDKQTDIDVQERLRSFRSKHQGKRRAHAARHSFGLWHVVTIAASLAAIICVSLLMFHRSKPQMVYKAVNAPQMKIANNNKVSEINVTSISGNVQSEIDKRIDEVGKTHGKQSIASIQAPKDKSLDITLPDGSVVMMSPCSRISYPVSFTGSKREVAFDGQAYFTVAKDKTKPFIVHLTDGIQTRVLGTQFYIDATFGAPTKITLVEGSVKVNNNLHSETLTPGMGATFYETGVMTVSTWNLDTFKEYKEGFFSYNNAKMFTVLEAIGKYYHVSVMLKDKSLHNKPVTFRANRKKNLQETISQFCEQCGVTASLENDKLVVDK